MTPLLPKEGLGVVDESIPLFVVAPFMGLFSKPLDESSNYETGKSYQPHLTSLRKRRPGKARSKYKRDNSLSP